MLNRQILLTAESTTVGTTRSPPSESSTPSPLEATTGGSLLEIDEDSGIIIQEGDGGELQAILGQLVPRVSISSLLLS